MGKYAKYVKKYNKEWESLKQFKGWLTEDMEEKNVAYCKVCHVKLRPHKTDLERHSKRKMHINKMNKYNPTLCKQSTLNNISIINNERKEMEIKLSAYIAAHSSINSVDHLNDLLISLTDTDGNNFKNLKLHRTKCTMIIKNVIAPSIQEELCSDIGNSCYSLMIDESTDVSVIKYLCLCIKYFSESKNKIITQFLGLCEVTCCTAEILATHIEDYLKYFGLKIENLIGLGTDGANNLCGSHHSVYTILKEKAPKVELVRCVAHSLHLCSSKAAETLPSSLEFLCKEVYNWFSCSPLRRSTYKDIFNLININEKNKIHNFLKYSETRWLARSNVIKNILEQWVELKAYFNIITNNESSYMAKTLLSMLNDNTLYIYLVIVNSVLFNVNIVNLLFQHENADLYKVHLELYHLLLNSVRVIINPKFLNGLEDMSYVNIKKIADVLNNNLALIDVELLDFGIAYRSAIDKYKVNVIDLKIIKERCRNFILKLALQITSRMPSNVKLFTAINYLHPEHCLNQIARCKINLELLFNDLHIQGDIVKLEYQWNNLMNIKWPLTEAATSEEFWITVSQYKNAGGEKLFSELAKYALIILSLPLSNATVERVFSQMNIVKTKIRNKINFKLLEAILRIRCYFTSNICCKNFYVTQNMIQKFNVHMYDIRQLANEDDENMANEETYTLFSSEM